MPPTYSPARCRPRPGPAGLVTDEELIALAVAQAVTGLVSDRQFLGTIGRLLPGFFPHLPDQSQFNRRLRRLTPWFTTVQLGVAELVASGSIRLVDGTLFGCANYAGCASKSEFAGHAAYGYCASKSRWYWGMRLLLVTDRVGTPVGYDPETRQRERARGRLSAGERPPRHGPVRRRRPPRTQHHDSLKLVGVQLIVPDKHKLGQRPPSEITKARIRLVIESVFATLNGRCASKPTSPRPSPDSPSASSNDSSHSPSGCSSTRSSAGRHAHSPPTTDDEPTSSL